MVGQITANELKTKGVSIIDEMIEEQAGVVITVRGKEKYVVLLMEEYNQLREYELDAAIKESKNEIENGKYYDGSIDEHLKRVCNV